MRHPEHREPYGADGHGAGESRDGRATPRRISSTALFRDDREVVIVHHGQEYRLRITKADKLILNK
jgi:hemin uptake protein HemP